MRECPLRGLTPQSGEGKSQKVIDSHSNDVSPLTQGLRYRAACDTTFTPYVHLQNAVKALLMLALVFSAGLAVRHVCIADSVHLAAINQMAYKCNFCVFVANKRRKYAHDA